MTCGYHVNKEEKCIYCYKKGFLGIHIQMEMTFQVEVHSDNVHKNVLELKFAVSALNSQKLAKCNFQRMRPYFLPSSPFIIKFTQGGLCASTNTKNRLGGFQRKLNELDKMGPNPLLQNMFWLFWLFWQFWKLYIKERVT
jgi:hypothetical protein